VNFNWNNNPPAANITQTDYTVRWTGAVQPQFNETYTFYTTTDDGVRLWVNNQELINEWIDQAPTTWSGSIALKAGQRYNLQMDYYQHAGGAVAYLYWSSPSATMTLIPQSQLYPTNNPAPVVSLISPTNGASYYTSDTIPLSATASETGGIITKVDFYRNTTLLGTVSNSPYNFTVTNQPAGGYSLTARATDATGIISTSGPVNMTVVSSIPSPSFVGAPTLGAAPLTVSFTDTSTGVITNRSWNWGDGTGLNTLATNVQHTYVSPGTNNVALTVSGPYGAFTSTRIRYIGVTNGVPVTITIQLSGNQVQLLWPSGTLQTAPIVTGPYKNITSAVSPFTLAPSNSAQFFRVLVH
jgi:PKD repeat protein